MGGVCQRECVFGVALRAKWVSSFVVGWKLIAYHSARCLVVNLDMLLV